MTNAKFQKLLEIIEETLGYNALENDYIDLYHEVLIKAGLSKQDIILGLRKLSEDKIVLKSTLRYAPKTPKPAMYAKFAYPSTHDYTKPVYTLKINRKNLSRKNIGEFILSVEDREIRVNEYIIGKPHGAGDNLIFLEHIRTTPAHTLIKREKIPNLNIKKSFCKILNELGFKGTILKAFFYTRSKSTVTYRGDKLTRKDLEEAGIKPSTLESELEHANLKSNPQ